jgi:ribonuclease-3
MCKTKINMYKDDLRAQHIEPNMVDALPYNPSNVVLTNESLRTLLQTYGVENNHNDINLYRMAFVHKSYCTRKNENFVNGNTRCPEDCIYLQECNNERLEFLGDSVLGLAVTDYLYERFPDNEEGFLTKMKTKLVNGTMLASLATRMGLGQWIIVSKQIEENGGRANTKLLEDVFEAFVGAIFLDFGADGYTHTKTFIVNLLESCIDFSELVVANTNYKDTFLKYYQQNHGEVPKFYELQVSSTRTGGKEFRVCLKNKKGQVLSTGKGPNKKAAEGDASLNALRYFGQVDSNDISCKHASS